MEYRASANNSTIEKKATQPTTVRLPGSLLDEAKEFLESGVTGITTMSGLMAGALKLYLENMRRAQVDQAFLKMAGDRNYQRLSRDLNEMFSISDHESLPLVELVDTAPRAHAR